MKIAKRRKRGRRGGIARDASGCHQLSSINLVLTLVFYNLDYKFTNKLLSIGLVNLRSVKGKEIILLEYMDSTKNDAFIITETWLKNSDLDKAWVLGSELNNNGYHLLNVNRPTNTKARDGGIALVLNVNIKLLKTEPVLNFKSFEVTEWTLALEDKHLLLVWIYHPPNIIDGTSNNLFIMDFLKYIGDLKLRCNQFIIMGDFNLYINNAEDADAAYFLDLCDTLGVRQLIDTPTHRCTKILDLVIVNNIDSPWIVNIKQGPYLLDHCVIKFMVEIDKPKVNNHKVKFRNFKAADTTKMVQDMHLDEVKGNSTDVLLLPKQFHQTNCQKSCSYERKITT